jgi:pilus assembly protein CpaC
MHRTNRLSPVALCSVMLGLWSAAAVLAQQPDAAPPPAPVPREGPAGAGAIRGTALVIPINGTQRVQMSTRRRIARADNPRESVARVQPVAGDPTSVLVTGLDAGVTHLTLTDEAGTQEGLDVVVQFDVEYLRSLLTRAVPTAALQPIPGSNNTIILTGTVAHAEDVEVIMRTAASVVGGPERVVNAMRVGGVQQVQLDVIVARVSRSELRRMSFDWFNLGQHHAIASTPGGGFFIPSTGITGPLGAPVITNGVAPVNGVAPNIFLGFFNDEQAFFGLLQALKDENLAKIKAEPRLVSLSGRPASFLDGGEQAVPVPAGLGQIGVQFEEFGTRLNFLPIVLGNGKIHLEVEPEISDLNPAFGTSISGVIVPGRTTQRVHTTVEIEDGQTLVIGGLIQHDVVGTTTKTPILGEVPFLGAAFSRKSYNEVEFEMVVMVTPHLVDPMACDQLPKVLPGQETRSPDDFELFLEGILEAPRGSREVCPDHHYMPAYKNDPTAAVYPCAGNGNGQCGGAGCGTVGPIGAPTPNAVWPTGTDGPAAVSRPQSVPAASGVDVRPSTLPPASNGLGAGK